MTELKRFLNPLSPFQKVLYTLILVFITFVIILFISTSFSDGAEFDLFLMPVVLFVAFGAFVTWMFLKALRAYDGWWNSLPDAERANIEQDFNRAESVSRYLLVEKNYAYIRNSGRAIPYEKIEHIDLQRGKNARCYMHIHVKNEKKVFVNLPSFSEGEQLRADLFSHRARTWDMA